MIGALIGSHVTRSAALSSIGMEPVPIYSNISSHLSQASGIESMVSELNADIESIIALKDRLLDAMDKKESII